MTLSNPYFAVILFSVCGFFLLEALAAALNVKRLSPEPPEEFRGIFDPAEYAKSQAYTREGERFHVLTDAFRLVVFLTFWLCGGFAWLDGVTRGLTASPVWAGLAGLALLQIGSGLIGLPFQLWETFKIEAKYGFNKTTPGVFWADQAKGLLLGALIGGPLIALLLWIFESVPNAWVWAWLATTFIMLALQYIAPRWLMPLFNKFTPLPDGALKSAIQGLSERCAFPVKELFVIDGSKRSTKANAFFAGFGKNKRIALYDTLIDKHTEPELLAVLAHEIGHFKRGHIVRRMVVAVGQMAFIFLVMGLLLRNTGLFAAFGVEKTSVWLSFVFFMILFEPVQRILSVAGNLWSRKHEYEADAYAADAMKGPTEMISALKRLAKDSLTNLTPHPLHVFLHYSHPPMVERVAALAAWSSTPQAKSSSPISSR